MTDVGTHTDSDSPYRNFVSNCGTWVSRSAQSAATIAAVALGSGTYCVPDCALTANVATGCCAASWTSKPLSVALFETQDVHLRLGEAPGERGARRSRADDHYVHGLFGHDSSSRGRNVCAVAAVSRSRSVGILSICAQRVAWDLRPTPRGALVGVSPGEP